MARKSVKETEHDDPAPLHPGWYALLCAAVLSIAASAFFFTFGNLTLGIRIAVVLYLILSVAPGKRGQITMGWMLNNIPGVKWKLGPLFVPFLLAGYGYAPRAVQERDYPDRPDNTFTGDDKEPLPWHWVNGVWTEMVRPMRIITGGEMEIDQYKKLPSLDPGDNDDASTTGKQATGPGIHLNYQATVIQMASVRYRILDPFVWYIRTPGRGTKKKLEYVEKEMSDTIRSSLRREYTKLPVGGVIHRLHMIERYVFNDLDRAVKGWGLEIVQVALSSPDTSHEVNTSLLDIIRASADAEAARIRGTGEGQQEGNRIKETAVGEAAAAKSMGMEPREVFLLRESEKIVKPGDKILFGGSGLAEAMATGATIVESFKKPSSPAANPHSGDTP